MGFWNKTARGLVAGAAILTAVVPARVSAQGNPEGARTATLASIFDLDGGAAAATAIHSADAITDGASFTIDAQPDSPRPLVATLTDADSSISACTLTVVGTLADGTAISATATLTGGSGAKSLSTAYNWATVTSSSVGTCTGEGGGDTVSLGTSGAAPTVYVTMRGTATVDGQDVTRYSPFNWKKEARKAKTSGSSTSVTSNTASSGAFTFVAANDILLFNVQGTILERKVVTRTDADNIVVNAAIDLTEGYAFAFKTPYFGPDTEDGWIPVSQFGAIAFIVDVDQMNGTGGITTSAECRVVGPSGTGGVMQVGTDNITAAGAKTYSVDLRLVHYDQCRIGVVWGTNDDATDTGTAIEQITVAFTGSN